MPSRKEDLRRASEVVKALVSEGLGYVVQQLELKWHLPIISKIFMKEEKLPEDLPVRLRKSFERLGGAYLKFGQFLSLRPDLVPEEYCNEFKKLLDEVHPLPYEEMEKLIEQELKRPAKEVFKQIDKTPLGSASIAQVHRATLLNGSDVVLKIQRPAIQQKIWEDMDILYYLAHKTEHSAKLKDLNAVGMVAEFENSTKKELNFIFEARNIDIFYNSFKENKKVIIPKVHWLFTTEKLLAMDYVDGVKLSNIINRPELYPKINRKNLAKTIADTATVQFFDLGFFHADLHPGNILVADGKIALLDFGIIGKMSKELVEKEVEVYIALVNKDIDGVVRGIIKTGNISEKTDIDGFEKEATSYLKKWYVDVETKRITDVLYNLFLISNKYNLQIPKEMFIFGKATLTAESCCWAVDPKFDFIEYSNSKIAEILKEQRKPTIIVNKFIRKSTELSKILSEIPPSFLDVLTRIKTGKFSLDMYNTDVRHLGYDVELSSNRVSYAMVMSSFVIAGALLAEIGPKYGNYSMISIFSFSASMFFFGMLMISVFKEGTWKYDSHEKYK